eukprot:TRINITY_DN1090_c0_g1_i2.p2 TRINITY_DN1090_c0_g1~~TRINITY_DN1090_c0_g1_i2.p2  ORF type:complete len:131 (+),score=28.38 TRINITY_DN1090_c0_g1_i2:98-490(+)
MIAKSIEKTLMAEPKLHKEFIDQYNKKTTMERLDYLIWRVNDGSRSVISDNDKSAVTDYLAKLRDAYEKGNLRNTKSPKELMRNVKCKIPGKGILDEAYDKVSYETGGGAVSDIIDQSVYQSGGAVQKKI